METVSAIFEHLGGPARVGAAIGVTTEHATGMRRRRSIPIRYWRALTDVEPICGDYVTYEDLVAAHSPPPEGVRSAPPATEATA